MPEEHQTDTLQVLSDVKSINGIFLYIYMIILLTMCLTENDRDEVSCIRACGWARFTKLISVSSQES